MDETFHLSYPHIRERLLLIVEKFDKDNYYVYLNSNKVCCSFSSACQVLIIDENKYQVKLIELNTFFEILFHLEYY
jgi:hypothetical protein